MTYRIKIRIMKEIFISRKDKLIDLSNYQVKENIKFTFRIKLKETNFNYPIKIRHKLPNNSLILDIKIALFNSKLYMPVDILVEKGAINTSTKFNALIYIMDKKSKANVIPGLKIYEKNILEAGHGLIIKNIKRKDTYYLESRGIEFKEAQNIILGF